MWLKAASLLMQGALEWSEYLYWDVSPPLMGCSFKLVYVGRIEVTTNGQQISQVVPFYQSEACKHYFYLVLSITTSQKHNNPTQLNCDGSFFIWGEY